MIWFRFDPEHSRCKEMTKRIKRVTTSKAKGSEAFAAGRWQEAVDHFAAAIGDGPSPPAGGTPAAEAGSGGPGEWVGGLLLEQARALAKLPGKADDAMDVAKKV